MTSQNPPSTLPDMTDFMRALAQVAQANPHHIDFTSVQPDDTSIVFSTKHTQLPPIPNSPRTTLILESILRRYPGKLSVNGRERYRPTASPGLHAAVVKPQGSFQTTPEQTPYSGYSRDAVRVHWPDVNAVVPYSPITGIDRVPRRLVRAFRHRDTQHSTRRIMRHHMHRVTPQYTLDAAAFQRTRFLLHDDTVLAALHPDDIAELERQGDEQMLQYVEQTLADFPGMTPQHCETDEQHPGEYLLFNLSQEGIVHADLKPGIKPLRLHPNWAEYRAEYASLVRAIHLDDSLPYVIVFSKAADLFKPKQAHPGPYLELELIDLIDNDDHHHQISWLRGQPTSSLPKHRCRRIQMTATVHQPDGSREHLFVEPDLLVLHKYDEAEAAITAAYSGDSHSLASFIFDAVWDYDDDHEDYDDADILQTSRIKAVRLLEGNHNAFVAELQHLANTFSPTAPRPNQPVTVEARNHSITWTPL